MKVFLSAFGDAGHAFPLIALGKELAAAKHSVTIQTWQRWQVDVEREGLNFVAAPEYQVFPTSSGQDSPYLSAIQATRDTLPLLRELNPNLVIADILTLAPALAAELAGIKYATLIPHLYPENPPGYPPFSSGAAAPRARLGRELWQRLGFITNRGLRSGQYQLNATRVALGLSPTESLYGGLSKELCLVATYPQLEYPRRWPKHVRHIGPLFWELPSETIELDKDGQPLILIAPSTAHDPEHKLLRAALTALADLPVKVIASANQSFNQKISVPSNAKVLEWAPYSQIMPQADLVICHGGHGTVVKALSYGVPLLVCPVAGDMFENAARVEWSGSGLRVPNRLIRPAILKAAIKQVLSRRTYRLAAQDFTKSTFSLPSFG